MLRTNKAFHYVVTIKRYWVETSAHANLVHLVLYNWSARRGAGWSADTTLFFAVLLGGTCS